jgi:hypothetical protein
MYGDTPFMHRLAAPYHDMARPRLVGGARFAAMAPPALKQNTKPSPWSAWYP